MVETTGFAEVSRGDHLGGLTVVTLYLADSRGPAAYVLACLLNREDQGQSCLDEIRRVMRVKGWSQVIATFADYEFHERAPHLRDRCYRVPVRLQPTRFPIKVNL